MTAEQALIEENKKDPRVRYITGGNRMNIVYENKPSFIPEHEHWQCPIGHREVLYYEIDFNGFPTYSDCILCIDDIKPEVPPISEKWYIESTEENRELLNGWRLKRCGDKFKNKNDLMIGETLLSQHPIDSSFYHSGSSKLITDDCEYKDYKEITLEQFKKYVLCEGEEKIEKKDFVENGYIISVDMEGNPFPKPTINSSLEFHSKKCWIEDRINYINQHIKRNIDSDLCINPDWISERNELIEKLKNL